MGFNSCFNSLFNYFSNATHLLYVEWCQVLIQKGGCTQHPCIRSTTENDREFTMAMIVTTMGSNKKNLIKIVEEEF